MGMRRAQHMQPQRAVFRLVVDELPLPGEKPLVFETLDGLARAEAHIAGKNVHQLVLRVSFDFGSSCPALCRASTSPLATYQDVDGRAKPGHDRNQWRSARYSTDLPQHRFDRLALVRGQRGLRRNGIADLVALDRKPGLDAGREVIAREGFVDAATTGAAASAPRPSARPCRDCRARRSGAE